MKLLGEHFVPKPSEIYRRFQFPRRFQKPTEGIAPYVAELRRLAQHCNFGETLESRLRDQLVCGLRDENLQRHLLCISDLTFNKALDRALAAEAAITEVATMRSSEQMASQEVQVVRRYNRPQERDRIPEEASRSASRKTPCYRCGGPHSQHTCIFKDAVCNFCKRVGHIERACRVKTKSWTAKQKHVPSVKQANTTNMVNKSVDSSCVNVTYAQSKFASCTPLDTMIHINGIPVKMEVDSGAAFTLISEVTHQQLSAVSNVELIPFDPTLRDFQGQSVSIMGVLYVTVEYGAFNGTLQVVVVKGNRCNLLGRNWFDPLNIHISGVHQLTNLCLNKSTEEYAELFSERLGTVNGPAVKLYTDDTVAPIQMTARRVPFALKQRVEEKLNRLDAQMILEPVQHATWATPIVPVLKPNGDCSSNEQCLNIIDSVQ
uniref:Peptidase A2 domain-containing protein n=1 Tax=Trichuris muris TaxID=70415 RepID=A0A5S6Q140_TRIMR